MQARHSGILVTKSILRPYAALTTVAVHCVDKAVFPRFIATGSCDIGIGKESRRHAWPDCEDNEGEEVTCCHCTATSFVDFWGCGRVSARGCVPVEPYQEEYGARYVDEGVYAVNLGHQPRILLEEVLDI